MGDEAGLGAASAITIAEHDDRQTVVAHEAGDAVIDGGHGEQRPRPFLGLHAARRDEADHRQVPGRAQHQQLAELLGAGHVERTGLEGDVGQHQAAAELILPRLEAGRAGDHAAGRKVLVQCRLNGVAEPREGTGVRADEIPEAFVPAGEEGVDDVLVGEAVGGPGAAQHALHLQILVGHVQAVPEVLAPADALGGNAAVVGLASALGVHIGLQQVLEQVGHHHEQRLGQIGKAGALPLLNGAEEGGGLHLGQIEHPQVPIQHLRPQPVGDAGRSFVGRIKGQGPGGQRGLQQLPDGAAGQQVGRLRLFGNAVQMGHDVVVGHVEQQQALAFLQEVLAQVIGDQHVEQGQLAELHR